MPEGKTVKKPFYSCVPSRDSGSLVHYPFQCSLCYLWHFLCFSVFRTFTRKPLTLLPLLLFKKPHPSFVPSVDVGCYAIQGATDPRRIQRRRRFSCSIPVPMFSLLPLAFPLFLCVNLVAPSYPCILMPRTRKKAASIRRRLLLFFRRDSFSQLHGLRPSIPHFLQ